jgi:hypothetical protein
MLKKFAFSLDSSKNIAILRGVVSPPLKARNFSCVSRRRFMAAKSTFAMRPLESRKRVLLVCAANGDAVARLEFLRRRGYEVDTASCGEAAVTMARTHSYDLIVLPADLPDGLSRLFRRLQRLNPNSTVACLADCKKPIPALPSGRWLWKGEPLEYFLARVDALAYTA